MMGMNGRICASLQARTRTTENLNSGMFMAKWNW